MYLSVNFRKFFKKFLARAGQKNIFEFWIFGLQSVSHNTLLVAKRSIRVQERSFRKVQVFIGEFQEIFEKFLARARQKNIFEFWIYGLQTVSHDTLLVVKHSIRVQERSFGKAQVFIDEFQKIFGARSSKKYFRSLDLWTPNYVS